MKPMSDEHHKAISEALNRVVKTSLLEMLVDRATKQSGTLVEKFQLAVIAEVPQFSQSRNPDLLPEQALHAKEYLNELMRLLCGRGRADLNFNFVQEYGRRRAEQRFPLQATLQAYRCGLRVVLHWSRGFVKKTDRSAQNTQEELAALSDFLMEYADTISTTFATAYSAHALLLADVAGDQRSELLKILLDGHDEADAQVARLLRDAGFLDRRQSFCVALARSVDPTEMLNASRARRMADSIANVLAGLSARRVIDVHENKVTMVFAAVRRESGWTAPRSSLAQEISVALSLVGNAALIGVSNDAPSTAHIPNAYREASIALELASVGERVGRFAEIPLRRLLLHFAADEFHRILPSWAKVFFEANEHSRGALEATLRTYANVDMNILQAAQVLGVHPNTVYARFQRVHEISGLRPKSFHGLNDLLIVCDAARPQKDVRG
jgi:hypothetical protein